MPDFRRPTDLRPGDVLLDVADPLGALYTVLATDTPGPGRLTVQAQRRGGEPTRQEWWLGTALLLLAQGRYIMVDRRQPARGRGAA